MEDLDKYKVLADKCPRNHECINQANGCICEIDYVLNNRVVFVNPSANNDCPYLIRYGYCFICECPINIREHKTKVDQL